jgi:hypothetical protein
MTRANLSPNLKQAVSLGTPVEVVDPATNEVYYLVSAEQYQRITSLLSGADEPRLAYPLIDKVMADDDTNDPWLESYQ